MGRTAQLMWHSLAEAAELVRTRAVSPVELTRACVDRIERVDAAIHAFASVDAAHALEEARAAEREIQSGRYRGPLHGIPIALKDNYDTPRDSHTQRLAGVCPPDADPARDYLGAAEAGGCHLAR